MRETPYIHSIPRQFPWVLGFAIVMAVTGPFGLYSYVSLGVRLIFFGTTAILIAVAVWEWLSLRHSHKAAALP